MEKDGKTNKEAKGEQDQGPPPDNKSLKDQVNRLLKVGKGMCVRWTAQKKVLDAMTPVEALSVQKAGADPLSNLGSAVFTTAMQAVHEKVGSSEEFKNAKDKEKSHILRQAKR